MSLVDLIPVVILIGVVVVAAAIVVGRGTALTSDPQDFEYWRATDDNGMGDIDSQGDSQPHG